MQKLTCRQEIADWDNESIGYTVPNHIYPMRGDFAIAYKPVGKDPVYFHNPMQTDSKGRRYSKGYVIPDPIGVSFAGPGIIKKFIA